MANDKSQKKKTTNIYASDNRQKTETFSLGIVMVKSISSLFHGVAH